MYTPIQLCKIGICVNFVSFSNLFRKRIKSHQVDEANSIRSWFVSDIDAILRITLCLKIISSSHYSESNNKITVSIIQKQSSVQFTLRTFALNITNLDNETPHIQRLPQYIKSNHFRIAYR